MLPTDANMDHGAKCNAIQNALQNVEVYLSFEQAAIVLSELNKELTMSFRLRRKKAVESVKTIVQQANGAEPAEITLNSCTEPGCGKKL